MNLVDRFSKSGTLVRVLGCLAAMACVAWLCGAPASAESGIDWGRLNLNPEQESEIDRLESQWKQAYREIYPQIVRDRAELKRLLNDSGNHEAEIMSLQSRIHANEERLRMVATQCFIRKKNKLNAPQRQQLLRMMPQ